MRILVALVLIVIAPAVFAQSNEFARATGGEIEVMTKSPRPVQASIGIELGNGGGYNATLGGELLQDRLWFFGSTSRTRTTQIAAIPELPTLASVDSTDLKAGLNLGSRQTLDAAFSHQEAPALQSSPLSVPSTFLALRYTGVVTPNMFFTMSVQTTRTGEPR